MYEKRSELRSNFNAYEVGPPGVQGVAVVTPGPGGADETTP